MLEDCICETWLTAFNPAFSAVAPAPLAVVAETNPPVAGSNS